MAVLSKSKLVLVVLALWSVTSLEGAPSKVSQVMANVLPTEVQVTEASLSIVKSEFDPKGWPFRGSPGPGTKLPSLTVKVEGKYQGGSKPTDLALIQEFGRSEGSGPVPNESATLHFQPLFHGKDKYLGFGVWSLSVAAEHAFEGEFKIEVRGWGKSWTGYQWFFTVPVHGAGSLRLLTYEVTLSAAGWELKERMSP